MEKISGHCCVASLGPIVSMSIFIAIMVRVAYVLYQSGQPLRNTSKQHVGSLTVLGLGGHTAEVIGLINVLQKDRFTPRFYIAAATGNTSLQKARVLEESLVLQVNGEKLIKAAQFMQIYRS